MFTLLGTDPSSKARRGILRTKRGDIQTTADAVDAKAKGNPAKIHGVSLLNALDA